MAVAMVDTVDTAEIVVVEDLATALEAASGFGGCGGWWWWIILIFLFGGCCW